MTTETTDTLLVQFGEAREQCNKAREEMTRAKTQKARREAEEELNWWQGKTAALESSLKSYKS